MYRVYQSEGQGVFTQIGTYERLTDAIADCPPGGKVEQVQESGDCITVHEQPPA